MLLLTNEIFGICTFIISTSFRSKPDNHSVYSVGLTVIFKQNWLFAAAFILGLLFDILSFKTIGISSAFLCVFLFLVLLYQSKFEITTGYFVLISSFLGSILFLFIQGYTHMILIQAVTSSIIALSIFEILKKVSKDKFLISHS